MTSDKPFFKERVFWFGAAVSVSASLLTNLHNRHRLLHRWFIHLGHAFLGGSAGVLMLREHQRTVLRQLEERHLNIEYTYLQNLGLQEGRFLEDHEREIKEVFKTVVF